MHQNNSVEFHGASLPVIELGEGAPIAYLHGVLGNPAVPEFVSMLAAQGHRVIAPSLPGFDGAQQCEQLRTLHDWVGALSEIIDISGLTGKTIVASSISAMLALELAAIRPEAFNRLVLIAPFGLWDELEPVTDLFATTLTEERALLTAEPAHTASFYEDPAGTDPKSIIERTVSRYLARSTTASLVWPLPEFGLSDRLRRVTRPCTLIWGTEDRLVPPSYQERFSRLLPAVQGSHLVQRAGHLAEWDQPREIAEIVHAAIRQDS